MSIIGFGKFSKFYWLIIISAAIKLIISIVYDLQYQTFETNKYLYNSSLINCFLFSISKRISIIVFLAYLIH